MLAWLFAVFGAIALLRIPLLGVLPVPLGVNPVEPWAVGAMALALLVQCLFGSVCIVFFLNERTSDRNRALAYRDPLTGALNRRAFSELADELDTTGGETSVLLFDIDRFKRTNDQFGHDVGDSVIKLVVAAASDVLGEHSAYLYRLGGEEFACVLPKVDSREAAGVAERIRVAYSEIACTVEGLPVNSTLSIGVAAHPRGMPLWQALKHADLALYRAKETGRDRVCIHQDQVPSIEPLQPIARRTERAA